jgi:deazaflavin-dependent oxidoreductase (nitroreductase family)
VSNVRDSFSAAGTKDLGIGRTLQRTPAYLRAANPVMRRMIGSGLPPGVNALLTVRGRKSGQLRTTPVAVIKLGGRRWIIGAFGEVDWVRNLRAAQEATLTAAGSKERFRATELSKREAETFFGEVLKSYFRQFPPVVRSIMPVVLGVRDAVRNPHSGAERHPVFEIRALGPRDV